MLHGVGYELGGGVGDGMTGTLREIANSTAGIVVGAAVESAKATFSNWNPLIGAAPSQEVTAAGAGVGLGWLRSLLGKSEWTLPCVNVKIRL